MDPLQAAMEAIMSSGAASSDSSAGSAAAVPASLQRTIRAALRLQQLQRDGESPASVLEATVGGLLQRLLPSPDHGSDDRTVAASASAFAADDAADGGAVTALPSADLESLAIEVEMCWQLLVSIGANASEGVVRDCGLVLFLLLRPQFRALHATAIAHLAQANRPALQQLLMQLLDEFLLAHTPLADEQRPMHPLLPLQLHLALTPTAVLQVAASALAQMSADPATAAQLQGLFELRLLPLYRLMAEAAAVGRATDAASGNDGPFSSLPALLHRHVLPLFLAPSCPLHQENLRTMYSTVLGAIDVVARAPNGGAKILPVLFAFLVDYFSPLCALMAGPTSPADSSSGSAFFNSLLLCAQLGLASACATGDVYLVKQSLALLVSRARALYSAEDAAIHASARRSGQDKGHKGGHRGPSNRHGARGSSTSSAPASSSSAAAAASARVPRHTCFPDYGLRTWLAYENIFDILSAYELHLVKFSFAQEVAALLAEHEAFYRHHDRARMHAAAASDAQQRFTPDIFLELLLKYAMRHANPYVRKYVYFTVLLQLKDRVRFSRQFLFLEPARAPAASGPAPINASMLHVLSSCAMHALLPSKTALLRFWQAQLDLLPSARERQEFLEGFLSALAALQSQPTQGINNQHANLTLHLNFLAHARLPPGEAEGGELALEPGLLLPALHGLARSNAATTSSTQAVLPRAALAEAIAWVYLRYAPGFGGSEEEVQQSLEQLAHLLCTVVPRAMQRRGHAFHRRLSARVNQGELLSVALAQRVERLLSGSVTTSPFGRASGAVSMSASAGAECAETIALFALLPPAHPCVGDVVRGVVQRLHEGLAAGAPSPHALALLAGLLALVGQEREAAADASASGVGPARGAFQSVMSGLKAGPQSQSQPQTQSPSTPAVPAESLLDSLLHQFFSSPSSCFSLLAFVRATLMALPGPGASDQQQQYGYGYGAQAYPGEAGPTLAHVRGMCFALLASLLRLYPRLTAVQQVAQQLVGDCLAHLLPAAASASSGQERSLPPLHECALVQVLCTVVQGCHAASQRGPLARSRTALAASAAAAEHSYSCAPAEEQALPLPLALGDLLSPQQYLALVSALCTTTLVSKLAPKALYTPDSGSFAFAFAFASASASALGQEQEQQGHAEAEVYAPQVLKAAYFCNSQLTRWSLLRTLLRWGMHGWQRDGFRPEALLRHESSELMAAQPHSHSQSQYSYDGSSSGGGGARSAPASSSSFASALFLASPSFLEGLVLPGLVEALDGSTGDYWPGLVGCMAACVGYLSRFQGAAAAILARVDPAGLGAQGQGIVLRWLRSREELCSSTLPPLFAQVWRSFQDVTCKNAAAVSSFAASSSSSEDEAEVLDQLDWPGWSELGRGGASGPEPGQLVAAPSSDPSVPPVYSALVDLFLHPLLFAEDDGAEHAGAGSASGTGSQNPRALVKTHLGLVLALAQRRGMRPMLYALTLRCVELWGSYPAAGAHYLPEMAVLLTLDNKLETRHGGHGNGAGEAAADSDPSLDGGAAAAAVPMEHLIRVLLLSLLEHLVTRANLGATPASGAAYTFASRALHYLLSLNFHHAEFSMHRCGGDNPADEVERTMDELAEQEEPAGGGGSGADSAGKAARAGAASASSGSGSSPATVTSSRVHVAISAIWHGLCILSRLRLRSQHCRVEDAANMKHRRTRTAAAAAAAAPDSASSKFKSSKHGAKPASSRADPTSALGAMPPPEVLDASYPLQSYVQSSVLVMFVSPALTSRIRHLLEIFLINFFTSNLHGSGPGSESDPHSASGSEWAGEGAASSGIAGASLRLEKALLPFLERTVFRQNIICSFLVVTGYLCSHLAAEQFRLDHARSSLAGAGAGEQVHGDDPGFRPLIHTLLSKLHVWSSSPLGQVRTVAQYFFYHLFLEVFHGALFDDRGRSVLPRGAVVHPGLSVCATDPLPQALVVAGETLPLSSVADNNTRDGSLFHVYYSVWLFLYRSTAVAAIRQRQDEYFRAFRPFVRGTVEGALRYSREFAAVQRHAAATSAAAVGQGAEGQGEMQEEDGESVEAAQLPALPAPAADVASSAPAADHSDLLSYGTQLSTVDLLLHVRRVTTEHLHALSEQREASYFDDSNADPLVQQAQAPAASASADFTVDSAMTSVAPGMQSLNFQQKIAPAKAQFLEDAAEDAPSNASCGVDDPSAAPALRLASCKHLVVCASLVSNPVNLGGLCRTAEIMQATLLLGDARLLHDASFVGVSSTANLWADIEIVPRGDALVAHLLAMRARGYAIVGLEQTVHSTPLQRTHFPDRVVLVLGDEKRGIPSSILNVLTHCVEIPQFGLIRSLNVHVSAGMLVWEYVKQALIEQEDAQNATAPGSTGAGVVLRQP